MLDGTTSESVNRLLRSLALRRYLRLRSPAARLSQWRPPRPWWAWRSGRPQSESNPCFFPSNLASRQPRGDTTPRPAARRARSLQNWTKFSSSTFSSSSCLSAKPKPILWPVLHRARGQALCDPYAAHAAKPTPTDVLPLNAVSLTCWTHPTAGSNRRNKTTLSSKTCGRTSGFPTQQQQQQPRIQEFSKSQVGNT